MEYDFLEAERRFYSIIKNVDLSSIKDEKMKSTIRQLLNLISILKELVANERRSLNRDRK